MICLDSALFPRKFLCKSHVAKNLPDLITQWPKVEFEPLYIPAAFNAISEWEYVKKESMCISFLKPYFDCVICNASVAQWESFRQKL